MNRIYAALVIATFTNMTQCVLQKKIEKSTKNIATFRHLIKKTRQGKKVKRNAFFDKQLKDCSKCCGNKCNGGSCGM